MKSTLYDRPEIETNLGNLESRNFSMEVNGATFRLVFDQLYTNKPLAIIRELSTNGYDGHLVVGKGDQPIHWHLPTALEPHFAVRDYGCSMDRETVMELYTTAFASSKRDSNVQVGHFGLGSKTPFAYTDSFTVITWLDGIQTTYLASMNADGIPQLTVVGEIGSDEPTGVQISFPVQHHDFHRFGTEAQRVAFGFDQPGVAIPTGFEYQAPEVFMEGTAEERVFDVKGETVSWTPRWKIIPSHTHMIRQGVVCYPVARRDLEIGGDTLNTRYGIVVDVPIGAVDLTPSRESLSMDDRTKQNATIALQAAIEEAKRQHNRQIDSAPRLIDALQLAHNRQWLRIFNELPKYAGGRYDLSSNKVPLGYSRKAPMMKFRHPLTWKTQLSQPKPQLADLKNLRFVINRGNVVAKRDRVADYVSRLQWPASSHVYIVDHPTPAQLERLIRVFNLEPKRLVTQPDGTSKWEWHQIIPISEITDPRPPKSKEQDEAAADRGGIYVFRSETPHRSRATTMKRMTKAKFEELLVGHSEATPKFYWYPIDKPRASIQVELLDDTSLPHLPMEEDGVIRWANALKSLGLPDKIVFLTPQAQKRYQREDVIGDWNRAFEPKTYLAALEAVADDVLVAKRSRALWQGVPHSLRTTLVGNRLDDFPNGYGNYEFLFQRHFRQRISEVDVEVRDILSSFEKRYPLCFLSTYDRRYETELKNYIQLMDLSEELDKLLVIDQTTVTTEQETLWQVTFRTPSLVEPSASS